MVAAVIILFAYLISTRKGNKIKIISRSEIERKKRLEELKFNTNVLPRGIIRDYEVDNDGKFKVEPKFDIVYDKYGWLMKGRTVKGRIDHIATRDYENDGTKFKVYEIVTTPMWFSIGRLKVASPFAHQDLLLLKDSSVDLDPAKNAIVIKREVTIDGMMGYHFDIPAELLHLNKINDRVYEHDKEANSSFYEAESQKRAIINLDHAENMGIEQIKLQQEREKRARMVS